MRLPAHITYGDPEPVKPIAHIHPAHPDSVDYVLKQSEDSPDGRSNWCWLRLPNGDLFLGVFPQGDTYFAVEDDARYPR